MKTPSQLPRASARRIALAAAATAALATAALAPAAASAAGPTWLPPFTLGEAGGQAVDPQLLLDSQGRILSVAPPGL